MSGTSTDLETRRLAALREHVVAQAMADAEARLGELSLEEAVVLVCAYEEEGAIGERRPPRCTLVITTTPERETPLSRADVPIRQASSSSSYRSTVAACWQRRRIEPRLGVLL